MSARRYTCGVPHKHCAGATLTMLSQYLRLEAPIKAHASRSEAYECMATYLVRIEGYTRGHNREFHRPGHPCRVLTKRNKFGGVLRKGKAHEGGRWMPEGAGTGGMIGST